MKYTITTYDKNGDEIVSRNYTAVPDTEWNAKENFANQIESILEDSLTYLEEQALDNGEEKLADNNE